MIFRPGKKLPVKDNQKKYIFLAGSIDYKSSRNWRKEVIDKLGTANYFFDPTNNKHDHLTALQMKNQIEWELDALSMADKIFLHFLPNALSPISLVELGLYVSTKKMIVVCPKEFYKSSYVYTLCEKYNTPIFPKIEQALDLLGDRL